MVADLGDKRIAARRGTGSDRHGLDGADASQRRHLGARLVASAQDRQNLCLYVGQQVGRNRVGGGVWYAQERFKTNNLADLKGQNSSEICSPDATLRFYLWVN